ncbi:OprD family porin [Pseudomonas protegens]|uniref:OprD family porin n=1 Tax=Pseudomonas protegens TaxID=380021 RepID=UPI001C8E603E|nr:OprD family porin [Pseudomonas protegens]QZI71423.1 OprD family porin [Pseudomonas protegens]
MSIGLLILGGLGLALQWGQGRALSLRQGTYRTHGTSNDDVDHIRLVTEYPFSLL